MVIVDQLDFGDFHKMCLVAARDVVVCMAYHKEIMRRESGTLTIIQVRARRSFTGLYQADRASQNPVNVATDGPVGLRTRSATRVRHGFASGIPPCLRCWI